MWSADEVGKIARKLVDELTSQRPKKQTYFREEIWASDYEHSHCYELLELHYESGDAYTSHRWKYQPITRMDEAERCMFNDWAD